MTTSVSIADGFGPRLHVTCSIGRVSGGADVKSRTSPSAPFSRQPSTPPQCRENGTINNGMVRKKPRSKIREYAA
jgi:hypothetical protein